MHLVFTLGSWLKASKTVGISCDKCLCYVNEVTFVKP